MKHAGNQTLDSIEPLLGKIRALAGLTERKRGIFYRDSSAVLHFHEDPAGVFADLKQGGEFIRYPANSERQHRALVARLRRLLAKPGRR